MIRYTTIGIACDHPGCVKYAHETNTNLPKCWSAFRRRGWSIRGSASVILCKKHKTS